MIFIQNIIGQRHAKRDLLTYAKSVDPDQVSDAASGQGMHFLTPGTSVAHTFLAVQAIG